MNRAPNQNYAQNSRKQADATAFPVNNVGIIDSPHDSFVEDSRFINGTDLSGMSCKVQRSHGAVVDWDEPVAVGSDHDESLSLVMRQPIRPFVSAKGPLRDSIRAL